MVNIHQVQMKSKDLAKINEEYNLNIPHGENFNNEEWTTKVRRKLESQPTNVLTNKFAGNSKYVPIDEIEATLDNIFKPLNWHTSSFNFYQIGGTSQGKALMGCSIELKVINRNFESPVWVSYVGTSSGYVSEKQGETFFPKLKAEAFKNAVKQIGNVFGRNLNRNVKDTSYAQQTSVELLQEISQADSISEIEGIIKGEGINGQIRQAVWNEYSVKWTELFRKKLKGDLKTVDSRKQFEYVMNDYINAYPSARDFFKNDPECKKMLSSVAKKYPNPKKN